MWMMLVGLASALTLEQAWELAEGDGEESVLLAEQRRQAELMRAQAFASLAPRVQLNGNWTRNQREIALDFASALPEDMILLIEGFTGEPFNTGEPTVIQALSYFDTNLTVIQPIFNARTVPGLRGAYAMVDAGVALERAGRADLRLVVARAWWGLRVAREAEKLATEAKKLAEQYQKQAAALVAAGQATRQAEIQAKMVVARAERERMSAGARREQAEWGLSALIGVQAPEELSGTTAATLPWATVDEALERSVARRPELAVALAQERVARAVRQASVLGWTPTLDARFTEVWSQNTGFSGENFNWMFVLSASWTLWDGGFRLVDNSRTASQLHQASAVTRQAQEQAEMEVRLAWKERERAGAAREAASIELELAEENLRMAEVSYREGASVYTDLENARLARDSARLVGLNETMNVELATLTLLAAVGDL